MFLEVCAALVALSVATPIPNATSFVALVAPEPAPPALDVEVQVKTFNSERDMLGLLADFARSPDLRAGSSTVIYVADVGAVYVVPEQQPPAASVTFPLWPFLGTQSHDVDLVEVRYGPYQRISFSDVPVTPCISSVMSSGGGLFTLTNTFSQQLALAMSPKIKLSLIVAGAALATGVDSLDITFGESKAIACYFGADTRVQVLARSSFLQFPEAMERTVTYSAATKRLIKSAKWTKLENKNPHAAGYGLVMVDRFESPSLECVTMERYLQCNARDIVDTPSDPMAVFSLGAARQAAQTKASEFSSLN
ncbi:Secreted protein [[Candida] zeylanoides]